MIASSDNTAPLPVTDEPDWSKAVTVSFSHQTQIMLSRTGKEQRRRSRRSPKARISWSVSGLTLAQAQTAMEAQAAQSARLCIVPFWTEGTVAITALAGNLITIGVDPRRDFFAAGQYVYFTDGSNQRFRQIASVEGRILSLSDDAESPAFGINTRLFPCRRCRRLPNDDNSLEATDDNSHELQLAYESAE